MCGGREGKHFSIGFLHFHSQSWKQSLSTLYVLYKRILPINLHICISLYFLTKYFCNSSNKKCATNDKSRNLERLHHSKTTGTAYVTTGREMNLSQFSILCSIYKGVDGWIILGWISRRWDVGMWTGLGWFRIGTGGGRL